MGWTNYDCEVHIFVRIVAFEKLPSRVIVGERIARKQRELRHGYLIFLIRFSVRCYLLIII